MDVLQKASFGIVKFQSGYSLTEGLLEQAYYPAGHDGIRRESSNLKVELKLWATIGFPLRPYDLLTHHFASC